jgi:hypothetical protein
MNIQGKLIEKFPVKQVSDSFQVRDFVIEIEENNNGSIYTNYRKIQLKQDKVNLIDSFEMGSMIDCFINLEGRKYEKNGETMYFNSDTAWKIEAVVGTEASQETPAQQEAPMANAGGFDDDDDGSLPF